MTIEVLLQNLIRILSMNSSSQLTMWHILCRPRQQPVKLCLNQIDEICQVSVKRRAHALRLISLAGSRSGLVGLLTVTQPPAVGHPGRQGRPLQGPAAVLSVRRGLG